MQNVREAKEGRPTSRGLRPDMEYFPNFQKSLSRGTLQEPLQTLVGLQVLDRSAGTGSLFSFLLRFFSKLQDAVLPLGPAEYWARPTPRFGKHVARREVHLAWNRLALAW